MRSRTLHTGPKPPDTARCLASAAPVGQIAASRHHAAARSRSPAATQATSARTTTEKTAVSENGAAILAPTGSGPGVCLPTPEQIAAEVRRRPIGAVIADICRDLGIMPSHPLWPELQHLIIRYGGNLANLVKDILDRAFPYPAANGPPAWPGVSLQSPGPSSTGPPP